MTSAEYAVMVPIIGLVVFALATLNDAQQAAETAQRLADLAAAAASIEADSGSARVSAEAALAGAVQRDCAEAVLMDLVWPSAVKWDTPGVVEVSIGCKRPDGVSQSASSAAIVEFFRDR